MASHKYVEQSGPFQSLVSPEWFDNPANSSIWLRLYACLGVPHDSLKAALRAWLPQQDEAPDFLDLGAPILFAFGIVRDLKVLIATLGTYSEVSGRIVLEVRRDERPVPEGTYISLATPFKNNGQPGDEPAARRLLDLAASLVCLHAGANLMRDCVFEGEVSGEDGRMSVPSKGYKVPKPLEGPYLGSQNGADIAEISRRLSMAREPKRGRIQLATRLMDAAMRTDQGFLEYWTALEVICDGSANRIMERFAKLYGLKGHRAAAELGGLGVLKKWRGDFVHKGMRPVLTASIERYLQLVFLDLLRFELDLPVRGHAYLAQSTVGFDLSPLGLSDNRTAEQKAREAEGESGVDEQQDA